MSFKNHQKVKEMPFTDEKRHGNMEQQLPLLVERWSTPQQKDWGCYCWRAGYASSFSEDESWSGIQVNCDWGSVKEPEAVSQISARPLRWGLTPVTRQRTDWHKQHWINLPSEMNRCGATPTCTHSLQKQGLTLRMVTNVLITLNIWHCSQNYSHK